MNPRPTIPLIPTLIDIKVRRTGDHPDGVIPSDGWGPRFPLSGF